MDLPIWPFSEPWLPYAILVSVIGIFLIKLWISLKQKGLAQKEKQALTEPLTDVNKIYAPRRGWTEEEKEQVRNRQDGRCRKCGKPPPRWEYHHRDGNRSNNSLSNCEGLCPNCHSVETHDE